MMVTLPPHLTVRLQFQSATLATFATSNAVEITRHCNIDVNADVLPENPLATRVAGVATFATSAAETATSSTKSSLSALSADVWPPCQMPPHQDRGTGLAMGGLKRRMLHCVAVRWSKVAQVAQNSCSTTTPSPGVCRHLAKSPNTAEPFSKRHSEIGWSGCLAASPDNPGGSILQQRPK
jgi:hypothetical protein